MCVIAIISPSVRKGRKSHRAALYIKSFIEERTLAEVNMIDLAKHNFPLFDERLKFIESPTEDMIEFAENIKASDAIIIIVPEYNGGYPASLKNAVDLLTSEWRRKPVAFVPVSDGIFAGSQVIASFQFILWKMGALTVPGPLRIPNIDKTIDENGIPADKPDLDTKAAALIEGLLWYVDAGKKMPGK